MESRASKLSIKRCIWLNLQAKVAQLFFRVLIFTLPSTTGYKVLYGTYLAAHQQNKLLQVLVSANVGVLFSLEIPPQACISEYKPDFFFSNFGFGVLHSQKCYAMFRCFECYLTKRELGIRFQQPSLIRSLYFLILTVYLSYLDQFLLPVAVMPFICQSKAQKAF